MKKTLYVIGNGFDLFHDLNTRYLDFAEYLKEHNSQLYKQIINCCCLKEKDIWSDFELALGKLDPNLLASYDDFDPFTDEDYDKGSLKGIYGTEDTVRNNLHSFLLALKDSLYEWVNQVKTVAQIKFIFDEKACFLTFNYTHTLEKIYHISSPLHIHGDISNKDSIVLGHNNDFISYFSDSTLDSVNELLEQFVNKDTHKDSKSIYEANIGFFKSLRKVENIVILGHSLSAVDSTYFEEICSKVDLDSCKFYVSYYDKSEIESKKNFLTNLGVKEDNLMFSTIGGISDTMDKSNLKLDFKD